MTDVARSLIHVRETLPSHVGDNIFEYPQWIPGDHRPSGPIDAIAGIFFRANGKELPWRRDSVDMYAFHVNVPEGISTIDLTFDFLAVSGTYGSGTYRALSSDLATLEPSCIVMYPANRPVRDLAVVASLRLPDGWHYGTALRPAEEAGVHSSQNVTFSPVSIEQLVDSPIIMGRYFKEYYLATDVSPSHFLDVVADDADHVQLRPETIQQLSNLVREASALYKSHHYDHYNFLLSLSDQIRYEGLEHHQSSDNGEGLNDFYDPAKIADEGDLLPHEFTHSWNGKYRRPIGLSTPDYREPMRGDLLWVYEGMTQYWGYVLATRCGIWTPKGFREVIASDAAVLERARPGRIWRNLQDTADASQTLSGDGQEWRNWRRRLEYYTEGALVWLDADTTTVALQTTKDLWMILPLYFWDQRETHPRK